MEQATGLGQSDLGRTVMYNRVAKLVGSFMWMTYARRVEESGARRVASPGLFLSACALLVAVCAFLLAQLRTSQLVLQVALVLSGVAYGFTDSGMTLLTVWAQSEPTTQRTHVALLNVGFTAGAPPNPHPHPRPRPEHKRPRRAR